MVAENTAPKIYSIAAHRGFADALVAGLVPRYREEGLGLARLTLLLPSSQAVRTVTEAFVRHYGASGEDGMLMPRMAVIGDLDLDEALGPLLDPLGASKIAPAIGPTERWLRIAALFPEILEQLGCDVPSGAALLRLARQTAQTMDRLLVEDIGPDALWNDTVMNALEDQSAHWQDNTTLFYAVQQVWLAELTRMGRSDVATRRNHLFDYAAKRWKVDPPPTPIIAAGITSAAPALARLLKVVSELPQGAVILPDLDLAMADSVWAELGTAGAPQNVGDPPFERGDAVTHPQYHLKLLLNRMGVARGEVRQWHRKGDAAAPPARTQAISSLFFPPEASKGWIDLPASRRRLSGLRLMQSANPEEEAQAIALLIREAVAQDDKRVALVTPDRGLARRVVQHLRRWNIAADDSAGQPLSVTPAGRVLLLLAECAAEQFAPVPLEALLSHPLVHGGRPRGEWLVRVRALERELRGPRPAPGLAPLKAIATKAQVSEWWGEVFGIFAPLANSDELPFADWLGRLGSLAEALCGEAVWSKADGRALSSFVEDLREAAREANIRLAREELHTALRDAMESVAVRPPYGGHPRVAIYGLLESRMARAELVICGGLNEGTWPATPTTDPLLAPAVLRTLGIPGADFRIGLSAHDLAGALGAPEVVLSRAQRDVSGPALASRFWLRVRALLGDRLVAEHENETTIALARAIDADLKLEPPPRPRPMPSPVQRKVDISVTALDRLRSDPYHFYASAILRLSELNPLDAEPSPAWRGTAAHEILEIWHKAQAEGTPRAIRDVATEVLAQMNAHPLMRALWEPRLLKALEWVEGELQSLGDRVPVAIERSGSTQVKGVTIHGKVDRIDRLPDGSFAIVDYKTGGPPSGAEVEAGYALQLGTLGLMARAGAFEGLDKGEASAFEYWSLAKTDKSDTGFGYIATPVLTGNKRSGIPAADFLPQSREFLLAALDAWILGAEPFTARLNPDAPVFTTYDQLMRLEEWIGRDG